MDQIKVELIALEPRLHFLLFDGLVLIVHGVELTYLVVAARRARVKLFLVVRKQNRRSMLAIGVFGYGVQVEDVVVRRLVVLFRYNFH